MVSKSEIISGEIQCLVSKLSVVKIRRDFRCIVTLVSLTNDSSKDKF